MCIDSTHLQHLEKYLKEKSLRHFEKGAGTAHSEKQQAHLTFAEKMPGQLFMLTVPHHKRE